MDVLTFLFVQCAPIAVTLTRYESMIVGEIAQCSFYAILVLV